MKGMIFTNFLGLLEETYGDEVLDQTIELSGVENDGAYTAVGNYPHTELAKMVATASELTGVSTSDLLVAFGGYTFVKLVGMLPELAENYTDTFDLIQHVQEVIHREVAKLYPDADLPELEVVLLSEDVLSVTYRSHRCLAGFARGMIQGCIGHFNENIEVSVSPESSASHAVFTLKRKATDKVA